MAYDWDEEITDNGEGDAVYMLLPEGVYGAVCHDVKRGVSTTQNCPQAGVLWKISSKLGCTMLTDYINLHENLKWKLLQLFRSAGLRKHGEGVALKFSALVGRTAFLKIEQESYADKEGNTKVRNKVRSYIAPDEVGESVKCDFDAALKQASNDGPVGDLPF